MVSIPISLIATVIGMYLMGYTLMSLLGLSLVGRYFGMMRLWFWKTFTVIWRWEKQNPAYDGFQKLDLP